MRRLPPRAATLAAMAEAAIDTLTGESRVLRADLVQDCDLLDEPARRGGIAEHAAARLDDEHLALVHADVGRGAAQCADCN